MLDVPPPSVRREVETLPIRSGEDVVRIRQAVRTAAVRLGFSLVDQTKLVTAASELARNPIDYGHGGDCDVEVVHSGERVGLRLAFRDAGPGIPDIAQALRDGYTTGTGLGMGLGGARRLVDEFTIDSTVGVGTTIVVTRWTWKR